jgi:hypothetical protein
VQDERKTSAAFAEMKRLYDEARSAEPNEMGVDSIEGLDVAVKREQGKPDDVLSPVDRALPRAFASIREDHLILPCHWRRRDLPVGDGKSYCDGEWHHTRRFFQIRNSWDWAPFERCPISVTIAGIMRESSGNWFGEDQESSAL